MHARGVGPAPIPVDEFSQEKLVNAIRFMLNPEVLFSTINWNHSNSRCTCEPLSYTAGSSLVYLIQYVPVNKERISDLLCR